MNIRTIELVRGGWGLLLLVDPATALGDVAGVRPDRISTAVARVLGARQLTQAVLSGVNPSPEVLAIGVWVDVAHAATAAGLAAFDRSRARGGLTDAAIAGGWAAFGHHDLLTGHRLRRRHPHPRWRDRAARVVLAHLPGGPGLLSLAHDARTGR